MFDASQATEPAKSLLLLIEWMSIKRILEYDVYTIQKLRILNWTYK